jgi:hypothetical protein
MLRAHSTFWQPHHEDISRDDFSEAPNEVYHHQKFQVNHSSSKILLVPAPVRLWILEVEPQALHCKQKVFHLKRK